MLNSEVVVQSYFESWKAVMKILEVLQENICGGV